MNNISFEIFPPRDAAQKDKLEVSILELKKYSPRFFSVTHGATGSSVDGTLETVKWLTKHGVGVAPHITNKINTKSNLLALLDEYRTLGMKNAVIIKGDYSNNQNCEFQYSTDLLKEVRQSDLSLNLCVACYPEFHPRGSVVNDIKSLQEKQKCGANQAITQFFYNFDAYRYFLDLIAKKGITIQIVSGILPILNFNQIHNFAKKCGAELPKWLVSQMEYYSDDPESQRQLGVDFVVKLMEQIGELNAGVENFHIYSLNQHKTIVQIFDALGYGQE